MGSNEEPDNRNTFARRDLFRYSFDKIAVPAFVGLIAGFTGAYINRRFESRHNLSVSVIRSDSAAPEKEEDIFLSAFDAEPTPTPIPEEDRVYTYTALIRNDGDFPEMGLSFPLHLRAMRKMGHSCWDLRSMHHQISWLRRLSQETQSIRCQASL